MRGNERYPREMECQQTVKIRTARIDRWNRSVVSVVKFWHQRRVVRQRVEALGMGVSVTREEWPVGCLTLTAVIHSARSKGAKLLHSRRTEGLKQCVFAATDSPRRVAVARTTLAKRSTSIPKDGGGRVYRVWE